MRVIVTGASGFVGRYLCRALRENGYDVVGIASAGEADLRVDVCDRDALVRAFADVRPQGVFHLAALAFVPDAEREPELADAVNRGGTANVLDAAERVGARTLVVSSGAVYGRVPDEELPADEQRPLAPVGAYAVSKAAAEEACRRRFARQEIVVARPFNHTGPGQSRTYVCSDFAAQVAECESGLRQPVIEVGDLSAERDFSDVRDVVEAYVALFTRGRPGEIYNVCSGCAVPIRRILELLLGAARRKIDVRSASERMRPGEVRRFYGTPAKLTRHTGWRPRIPLQRTLEDLLADWRVRVGAARKPIE